MLRRRTISELRYSSPPDPSIAKKWSKDFSTNLLGYVWLGYDLLCQEVLSQIDLSMAEDDLERNITEWLEPRIRRFMPGHAPFYVQQGTSERETRKPAPAQPPQYDIAFVLYANERFIWPLEAKVLKSHHKNDLRQYVRDIKEEFLKCRYAPFSGEGAMLGYLLSNDREQVFQTIEQLLPCNLVHHTKFTDRPHKTSDHKREVPPDKCNEYPVVFLCHHLILQVTSSQPK